MQAVRARLCALAAQRLRGPPVASSKKAGRDKGPRRTGELSCEVATGAAIKKGENDPPILADSEYPPWLFKLLEPRTPVSELLRRYEAGVELDVDQMQRLWRQKNKLRIKEHNLLRAKK